MINKNASEIVESMVRIANTLDDMGMHKEADAIDESMVKIAQLGGALGLGALSGLWGAISPYIGQAASAAANAGTAYVMPDALKWALNALKNIPGVGDAIGPSIDRRLQLEDLAQLKATPGYYGSPYEARDQLSSMKDYLTALAPQFIPKMQEQWQQAQASPVWKWNNPAGDRTQNFLQYDPKTGGYSTINK